MEGMKDDVSANGWYNLSEEEEHKYYQKIITCKQV